MDKIIVVERVFNKGNMMLVIRNEDGSVKEKRKPVNGDTVCISKKDANEFASCFYTEAQLVGAVAQTKEAAEVSAALESAVEHIEGLTTENDDLVAKLGDASDRVEELLSRLGDANDEIEKLTTALAASDAEIAKLKAKTSKK